MKRAFEIVCVAAIVASLGSAAVASVITFDDLDAGGGAAFAPADTYRDVGVVFSRDFQFYDVVAVDPTFAQVFYANGGAPPNSLVLTPGFPGGFLTIDATFVMPGTNVPTTMDHVSAFFGDSNAGTSIGVLEAYDATDQLLGTDTAVTDASFSALLEVSAPGIAYVRFTQDADGGVVDSFAFTPEPATLSLLALGGLSLLRRRRKQ